MKVEVKPLSFLSKTIYMLNHGGLLLASIGNAGKPNVMTIGWGLIGTLWRKPVFTVAVRPSRYTYRLIEETGCFTVNVPAKGMKEVVKYCGTFTGRVHNKFMEKGLNTTPGITVIAPTIAECAINYECKVLYKVKVRPKTLTEEVCSKCYPKGNYHTLYFGEILKTLAQGYKEKHEVKR